MQDDFLIQEIQALVAKERKVSVAILMKLSEIDRCDLHLARGFSSLYNFCTRALGYSDSAAMRRIHSMRLIQAFPECEKLLQEGEISLTTASLLQTFLKKNPNQLGKSLVQTIRKKTKRECEKLFASLVPESSHGPDRIRPISATHHELTVVLPSEVLEKLMRAKDLLSHQLPDPSMAMLIEKLADITLKTLEKKVTSPAKSQATDLTRYIPKKTIAAVWKKSEGRCCYVDPKTGRQCDSTYQLQVDHITPYALGGKHDLGNLRLLCAPHNRFAAKEFFPGKVPDWNRAFNMEHNNALLQCAVVPRA